MAANHVQVVEKNVGPKIEWAQSNTKLIFGDDDLSLNCAKRQREQDIEVDICFDSEKNLVIGTSQAESYVAQILIPGFKYEEVETEVEGETVVTRVQKDLDMSEVVLTLWAIA